MLFASDFRKQARDFYQEKVADVYEYYERELRKNNALDFDDLLLVAVKLLQSNEAVLDKYSKRFRYVMIDEYQDTNHAQYLLAKLLASHWKNIAVVGDADQSIYAWRGADIQNILDFEKDYPNCTSIKLEQNYRSTKIILDAANAVIENNEGRPKKNLWTDKTEGAKIQHFTAQSEHEEAAFIGDTIAKKHDIHGVPYGDMAILYRTNAQSRVLEEALIKRALPYTMVGGTKFYDRKEIKDIIAYLNIINNPRDGVSFERVINTPKRGIGAASVEKLRNFAAMHDWSMVEAAQNVDLANISGKAGRMIGEFGTMITQFQEMVAYLPVTDIVDQVLERTGYLDELKNQRTLEAESRLENLEEFRTVTKEFDKRNEVQDDEEADAPEEKTCCFLKRFSFGFRFG